MKKIPSLLTVVYNFSAFTCDDWEVAKYLINILKVFGILSPWNFKLINLPEKSVEALPRNWRIAAQTGKKKKSTHALKYKSRITNLEFLKESKVYG